MTDFNHHYKDRQPEETIKIIEDFFQKRNITIRLDNIYPSISGTWSCTYALFYNQYKILSCNGKGMTEIYSKASCFAELYERFCFYAFSFLANPLILQDVYDYRFKKFGYHLYPDEKSLSSEEIISDPYLQSFFKIMLPDVTIDNLEKYLTIHFNKQLYAAPFYSLDKTNKKYFNYQLLFLQTGTTGLASGNTLEEALVQGSSEIYERYAIQSYYSDISSNKQYFYLKRENLNPILQNLINTIEQKENVKIKIYDLSYTYNIPVCCLLIEDQARHIFHINFGAHPVIDIAIERCLTEIYQGLCFLPIRTRILTFAQDLPINRCATEQFKSAHNHDNIIIPEHLILNSKEIDSYNSNIFLSGDQNTNNKLLEHIIKINNLNNLNFFYTNLSLSNKVFTVAIINEDMLLNFNLSIYDSIAKLELPIKNSLLTDCSLIVQNALIYKNNLITKEEMEQKIVQLLQSIMDYDNQYHIPFLDVVDLYCQYLGINIYDIYRCSTLNNPGDYLLLAHILLNQSDKIVINSDTILSNMFQLLTLIGCCQNRNIPNEITKKYLTFLGFNVDDQLLSQQITGLFIIKRLFFDELYNKYHSTEYMNFIKLFDKEDTNVNN